MKARPACTRVLATASTPAPLSPTTTAGLSRDGAAVRGGPDWRSLGALAAGFGAVSLSLAQTVPPAPASAEDATTMPPVTVRAAPDPRGKESYQSTTTRLGKGEQELRDVPQSVTVVTERLIDDRNLDTLKDALRSTAGISFLAAEGGEEDIRLRGFSLQATGDIFIDGLRDPAFYERDSFNWDRLEVLRGSASMLFGRGSTGGAVNQVSKQPRLLTEHEVAVTVGSGDYLRGVADLNVKTGPDAALRIAAMATVADGYGVKTDKTGFAPTLRFGIGTADEFSLGLYHLDNDNGVHYGLPWLRASLDSEQRLLLPVNSKNYYGLASDYNRSSASYGTASHVHRFLGGGEWRTALRVGRFERDQRAGAIRLCGPTLDAATGAVTALNPLCPQQTEPVTAATLTADTVLTRGTQNKLQQMHTRYLQSDYSGRFDALGVRHSIQTGVDLADEAFTNDAAALPEGVTILKPTTTVGTPNDRASVDESLRVRTVNRTFDAKAIGLYVQDLVQVAPAWKILGGLRWDRFEGEYWGAATTGANPQPAALRERSDSLWSHRVGLLYQPTARQSYHLSYGTSFNTSGDTYQYDALGSNTGPEKSRNVEIGAKLDSESGDATLRLALFHSTKYNERNRDEESVDATNYVLSGQRHAAGLEVDVAGRVTPSWEVFTSYTWIPSAKIDKGASDGTTLLQGETVGTRPGLTPEHSGSVWTTWRLQPGWRVGGGLNLRGKMRALQSSIEAPGWVTADLMTEYSTGPLTFKLNLSNLTDKRYADVLYRGHYIAGKPRALQFTVASTF